MIKHGPSFGYYLTECHIITKKYLFEKAQQIFVDDEVEVVDSCRALGSVIGSDNADKKFVERSLKQKKLLLRKLAAHANVSHQNFCKSFTSCVQHKLTFLASKTPNFEDLLRECEKSINYELLPNLLKNPAYNPKYRNIFSLPIREGGLNILKPNDRHNEYERSIQLSRLFSLSLPEAELKQQEIIHETKKRKSLLSNQRRRELRANWIRTRFAHLT